MNHPNRLAIAVGASLLAHSLLLVLPGRKPGAPLVSMAPPPLTVRLMEPRPPEPPVAPRVETAPIQPRPAAKPVPRVEPRPAPPPVERPAPLEAPPQPQPAPTLAPPPIDMLAMIEERRERRRAAEEARRPPVEAPPPDAATRNLQTLTGREGVGGVFQILDKGTRTGSFAFNGWRPSAVSRWREVIEVEARPGESVELAMVRRMIALIRSHYTGDFRWESFRLGRVVVLSARPEDNEGLEDFLMKEFFGQPVLNPRAGARR